MLMLLLLFRLIFAGRRQLRFYIFADDSQRFLIAVAVSAHNSVLHLFCLGCHAVLPQCPACKTDEIENIAVLPNKGAGRPFAFLFQRYRSFLPERLGGVRPMVF